MVWIFKNVIGGGKEENFTICTTLCMAMKVKRAKRRKRKNTISISNFYATILMKNPAPDEPSEDIGRLFKFNRS